MDPRVLPLCSHHHQPDVLMQLQSISAPAATQSPQLTTHDTRLKLPNRPRRESRVRLPWRYGEVIVAD